MVNRSPQARHNLRSQAKQEDRLAALAERHGEHELARQARANAARNRFEANLLKTSPERRR